jgi:hypothetical protein
VFLARYQKLLAARNSCSALNQSACGLPAFDDRLDNPGRQERQPHHAPHMTGRKMFSPGDLADRPQGDFVPAGKLEKLGQEGAGKMGSGSCVAVNRGIDGSAKPPGMDKSLRPVLPIQL